VIRVYINTDICCCRRFTKEHTSRVQYRKKEDEYQLTKTKRPNLQTDNTVGKCSMMEYLHRLFYLGKEESSECSRNSENFAYYLHEIRQSFRSLMHTFKCMGMGRRGSKTTYLFRPIDVRKHTKILKSRTRKMAIYQTLILQLNMNFQNVYSVVNIREFTNLLTNLCLNLRKFGN
jgi:hypothetical protein